MDAISATKTHRRAQNLINVVEYSGFSSGFKLLLFFQLEIEFLFRADCSKQRDSQPSNLERTRHWRMDTFGEHENGIEEHNVAKLHGNKKKERGLPDGI